VKAFIIYIKGYDPSETYAKHCLNSCKDKFNASLFEATTAENIEIYIQEKDYEPINPSRAYDFYKKAVSPSKTNLYLTKKSIFITATRLWQKCVELNEPIVVLEHDSICLRKWDNSQFEDVLILNGESCWTQKQLSGLKPDHWPIGVSKLNSRLKYRFNNKFKGAMTMPGAAAYAIQPHAAQKLLEAAYKYGWEQNDHFINTYNVTIQTIVPEYFKFKLPNLKTSHGFQE
jgi:hypothetical protein